MTQEGREVRAEEDENRQEKSYMSIHAVKPHVQALGSTMAVSGLEESGRRTGGSGVELNPVIL